MIRFVILILILNVHKGFGQEDIGTSSPVIQSFKEGEWFQLRLHYGPFNASYASFSLERDTLKGNPVFHA